MNVAQPFDWQIFGEFERLVVLCHASYELERSKKIAQSAPTSLPIQRCIISASTSTLKIDPNYRESLEGLNSVFAMYRHASAPTSILSERSDLIGFLKQMHAAIADIADNARTAVLLDISVFPKDRLFLAVDLVRRVLPHAKVVLGYSEPRSYDTDSRENGWLSKGVVEVISLPGFNGRQDPGKKSLLVLNMGHENERMSITINNREPQKLILIAQGDEQMSQRAGNYAAQLFERIRADYGSIIDSKSVVRANSKDMASVKAAILSIYDQYSNDYNIAVAFLGTKIQAIGALLACQENRSVEAVYAQPQLYHRENYSQGVADSFMVALN